MTDWHFFSLPYLVLARKCFLFMCTNCSLVRNADAKTATEIASLSACTGTTHRAKFSFSWENWGKNKWRKKDNMTTIQHYALILFSRGRCVASKFNSTPKHTEKSFHFPILRAVEFVFAHSLIFIYFIPPSSGWRRVSGTALCLNESAWFEQTQWFVFTTANDDGMGRLVSKCLSMGEHKGETTIHQKKRSLNK